MQNLREITHVNENKKWQKNKEKDWDTPKDQTSDLLLNLQYLMTSGADHLTGNFEHCELVYWSSRTNLQPTERRHVSVRHSQIPKLYTMSRFNRTQQVRDEDKNILGIFIISTVCNVLPGHAKIRHLHFIVLWNKTVSGCLQERRKNRRKSWEYN